MTRQCPALSPSPKTAPQTRGEPLQSLKAGLSARLGCAEQERPGREVTASCTDRAVPHEQPTSSLLSEAFPHHFCLEEETKHWGRAEMRRATPKCNGKQNLTPVVETLPRGTASHQQGEPIPSSGTGVSTSMTVVDNVVDSVIILHYLGLDGSPSVIQYHITCINQEALLDKEGTPSSFLTA